MKNKVVVIIGSSRNDGDTKKLIDEVEKFSAFDKIDLNDYHFSYYDYEHRNANDDYINLMTHLISNYDTYLFATPVYWYTMSGIMKVFFDRITDLLDIKKELGRQLRIRRWLSLLVLLVIIWVIIFGFPLLKLQTISVCNTWEICIQYQGASMTWN